MERYIRWEMLHADVLVCDGDQQQVAWPSKYGRLKLRILASNVPITRSTEYHQLRPETVDGKDWM